MSLVDDFTVYAEEIGDTVRREASKYETYARIDAANTNAKNALASLTDGERIMIALAILAMVIK